MYDETLALSHCKESLMRRLLILLLLASFAVAAAAEDTGRSHIVMLIAEREYSTDQTLPAFARARLGDYRSNFVFADPNDRNRLHLTRPP